MNNVLGGIDNALRQIARVAHDPLGFRCEAGKEAAHLLNDLKTVVNENGLSMNDKERMDIIDRCYNDMLQNRSLVQYYTNKNIGVSYLRAKKRNDLDRVMALYGSPNERYW